MAVTLGVVTGSGGSLQVLRRIRISVTGTGTGGIAVPHGLSYTPTNVLAGLVEDSSTPGAGPTVNLDPNNVLSQGTGTMMDATYVYLWVSGPGTFDLYVG